MSRPNLALDTGDDEEDEAGSFGSLKFSSLSPNANIINMSPSTAGSSGQQKRTQFKASDGR